MNRLPALLVLAVGCAAEPHPALQDAPSSAPAAAGATAGQPTVPPAAWTNVTVALPAHRHAAELRPESPFGINTALRADAPDRDARLAAMQQAGVKWGRQDFTWGRTSSAPRASR